MVNFMHFILTGIENGGVDPRAASRKATNKL